MLSNATVDSNGSICLPIDEVQGAVVQHGSAMQLLLLFNCWQLCWLTAQSKTNLCCVQQCQSKISHTYCCAAPAFAAVV